MTIKSIDNNPSSSVSNYMPSGAASAFKAASALVSTLNSILMINSTLLRNHIDSEKAVLNGPQTRLNQAMNEMKSHADKMDETSKNIFGVAQQKMAQAMQELQQLQKQYQSLFDLSNEQKNMISSSIQQMLQMMSAISQSMQFTSNLTR